MSSLNGVFEPIKLDVDLVADRRTSSVPDAVGLVVPEEDITSGGTYEFTLTGWKPDGNYTITVDHGEIQLQLPKIIYTAPTDYVGLVVMKVVQKDAVSGRVVFPDGTSYDEDGNVFHSDYPSTVEVVAADEITPPVPTNEDGGPVGSISLESFSVTSLFGDIGSVEVSSDREQTKNGNVADYYLNSEQNKQPDQQPYLYRVDHERFLGIPRNSNVTGSGGNIFVGYGTEGGVGGSLKVIRGSNNEERVDVVEFEIVSRLIDAIMPENIVSLCLTTATFTPIIKGEMKGHTFEWEQVGGDTSSITWLTPKNQISMTVAIGTIKVDRTFRFWIDKGTKFQKWYDVNIWSTPREEVHGPQAPAFFGEANNHLQTQQTTRTMPLLLWDQMLVDKELVKAANQTETFTAESFYEMSSHREMVVTDMPRDGKYAKFIPTTVFNINGEEVRRGTFVVDFRFDFDTADIKRINVILETPDGNTKLDTFFWRDRRFAARDPHIIFHAFDKTRVSLAVPIHCVSKKENQFLIEVEFFSRDIKDPVRGMVDREMYKIPFQAHFEQNDPWVNLADNVRFGLGGSENVSFTPELVEQLVTNLQFQEEYRNVPSVGLVGADLQTEELSILTLGYQEEWNNRFSSIYMPLWKTEYVDLYSISIGG